MSRFGFSFAGSCRCFVFFSFFIIFVFPSTQFPSLQFPWLFNFLNSLHPASWTLIQVWQRSFATITIDFAHYLCSTFELNSSKEIFILLRIMTVNTQTHRNQNPHFIHNCHILSFRRILIGLIATRRLKKTRRHNATDGEVTIEKHA